MSRYIVANWKANKTWSEAKSWLQEFCSLYNPAPHLTIIIAPPAIHLAPCKHFLKEQENSAITLAIQDLSPFPLGSYTGALPAELASELVDFAILGHSERRRYFHETNQDIANKASEAASVGIKPIVCVDQEYARAQLAALDDEETKGLIIGYGPREAAGVNRAQAPATVAKAMAKIQAMTPDAPLLYGGSVTSANAADYLNIAGVAGLMVGSASLDAQEFAALCTRAAEL